jgi:hypothetical protein
MLDHVCPPAEIVWPFPESHVVRVRGGGIFPLRSPRVSYSRPLVDLTADRDGLHIRARGLFGRLGAVMGGRSLPADQRPGQSWECRWEDIQYVGAARRSLMVHTRDGDGFRFDVSSKAKLQPLYGLMTSLGIPAKQIRSTLRSAFSLLPPTP